MKDTSELEIEIYYRTVIIITRSQKTTIIPSINRSPKARKNALVEDGYSVFAAIINVVHHAGNK